MTTTTPGSYGAAAADRTDDRRRVWTFTETKLGYKTSEFLMMLIFAVGVIIAAYASSSDALSPGRRLALRQLRRHGVHREPWARQARDPRALRPRRLNPPFLDEGRRANGAGAPSAANVGNGPRLRPGPFRVRFARSGRFDDLTKCSMSAHVRGREASGQPWRFPGPSQRNVPAYGSTRRPTPNKPHLSVSRPGGAATRRIGPQHRPAERRP